MEAISRSQHANYVHCVVHAPGFDPGSMGFQAIAFTKISLACIIYSSVIASSPRGTSPKLAPIKACSKHKLCWNVMKELNLRSLPS